MPDTVVEFVNDSYTYSEMVAGVNIVANAATEQAVVKDVAIESSLPSAPFTLKVGDQTIATGKPGLLSGTEIVGAGTTLKLFGPSLLLNRYIYGIKHKNLDIPFFEGSPSADTFIYQTDTAAAALTVTPIFSCVAANGDFYYGSATDVIYRRAGGIDGAETNQAMGYIGRCYDGARYIYSVTADTTLNVLDTTTNTITTVAIATIAGTAAEVSACAIDGYIFIKRAGASLIACYNATTGTRYAASLGLAGGAFKYMVAVGKTTNGDYVLVSADDTAPYVYHTILGKTLTNTITGVTGSFTGEALTDVFRGAGVNMHRVTANSRYIIALTSAGIYAFDVEAKSVKKISATGMVAAEASTLLPNTTELDALYPVLVRATGIKTTL